MRNEQEMRRMSGFLRDGALAAHKRVATTYHVSVNRRIPFKTGLARWGSRWAVNIKPDFVPVKGKSGYPLWGSSDVRSALAPAVLGDTFFWRNRTHAQLLQDPAISKQAPEGFVEQALEDARADLERWTYEGVPE
jgi:hypothetical protein